MQVLLHQLREDAELPYPLSRVIADMEEALSRKSFHDRIAERLARDESWR